MRAFLAGVLLCLLASRAGALEVWLASTDKCNSCAIYERVAQQRGYGSALRYADGAGGTRIPILAIGKNVLAQDMLAQLPKGEGPDNPNWDVTLTVLVVDAGKVLTAGNIADSADNLELREPQAVMFPPAAPADGDPSLSQRSLYTEFFLSHWNLEYFVDVALGKRPKRVPVKLVDLASPAPAPLGARNVVLWGSAGTPLANSLFIPTRIAEIRAALEAQKLGSLKFVTLFGHGPGVDGNDTSYIVDGRTQFKRAGIHADYAADAAGVNSVLTGVLRADRARTLLVQVGHSGPAGSPLWGHGMTVLPADLEPLKTAAGKVVMVSGACNGGMFAKVAQCGFFAAHPDVRATGCQLSPAALESSDDYLRLFFRGASGAAAARPTTGLRSRAAPAPTLYDAHWYASTRLEDHQLSYTTTDALIDDYFAAHADRLPPSLTVAQIREAARTLPRAEADAAAALTAGLAPELPIALTGYVEANHAAEAKLADARERSSAERNAIIALPYKLELALLARRIAYASLHVADPQFALAASCEQQSLAAFFGGR
ncbi:MAG TPA: hypothetical protein VHH11_06230 [Gammaproteobacteria bacterium]|nr:hypothetical protein [Gammaproteobacteria bacterium]